MTSKLYFQDDSIQLIEVSSSKSSAENVNYIQSPKTLNKLKKNNKIDSPTNTTTNLSIPSCSNSKISDIFLAKQIIESKRKPIPTPRTLKPITKSNSKENCFSNESSENVRKSSTTIDTISGDLQSIFSQKSETSYKERLRNRFLTVKKHAESSVKQKENIKTKKKKFEETVEAILNNEDVKIQTEFNKYKEKFILDTDYQKSYDFFCKVNEGERKIVSSDENIIKTSSDVDLDENTKQSVSEFLGIDNLESELIEFMFPNVVDLSLNEETIFRLNKKRYRLKNKSEFDLHVRNFEEEGIYKSKISYISKSQLTNLEDRLFDDENRNWFGEDAQLKILPDPRLGYLFKPFNAETKHFDFINKFSLPTLYEPADNFINIYENTLELIINELSFKHHSLFSKEHVLGQKLIHYYTEYKNLIFENVLMIYTKKLDALRCAKNRLEDTIKESDDCSENQLKKYQKYIHDIKIIREKIYQECEKERMLKKTILFVWKSLKNLRKTQKYSSTSIKLIIQKESVDFERENQIWEQNLNKESSEILEELENNFEIEMNDYKAKLKLWKQQQQNDNISGNSFGDKPKKPKKNYFQEEIRNQVLQKMNLYLKPPGEPLLDFDLKFNNDILENIDDLKENLRRNNVSKTKIFIKILCNNREICKSKLIPLNDNFICNFHEQFLIRLYKIPNSLCIKIFQQASIVSKMLLSEISVSIPDFNNLINDVETQTRNFENLETLNYNHSAVGTGFEINKLIQLEDFDENKRLFTIGSLTYKIGWTLDKSVENFTKSFRYNSNLIPTLFDIENFQDWIKNYPDPLDPNNALFFDYIKNLEYTTNLEKHYFRIDPDISNLEFCSLSELENNPRFKLLQLRFNNEPEFKGIVVPSRIKEISEDMFTSYTKRKKEEKVVPEMLTEQFDNDYSIDTQRKWARKYLEQAENRIIQLNKIAERKITLKDVLNEEGLPTFGSLGLSFMNWLKPKRPLRPTRKQTKQSSTQLSFNELNILVNIIGAIQIPSRKDLIVCEQTSSSSRNEPNTFTASFVRPFVTVSFRDECLRTSVAEGPNPTWNQELNVSLRTKAANFTFASLQNIKDYIKINLFDETVDDLTVDDRIRDRNIHQQLGCNWLGYFEIPFKTLLFNNRIEGTFKINLPTVLVGYERQNIKSFQESTESVYQKFDTFLTVFITLQPHISQIEHNVKNDLESIELQYLEEHIINWQNNYNILFPQRKFSCFVTTLNGEKCCITRYFQEIKLPQFDSEPSEVQIAKYVSFIPFRENGNSGLIPDIWLNPEQLLTLMMGSIKDHAVLLTCYFLTLELKSWFLFGYGLIDGYTAYVLIQEKGYLGLDYFIYNVKTGTKHNIYDNNCSLQKVFFVVNNENVWANIQEDDRINLTRFDFSKNSDWLPLFNRDISPPTNLQLLNIVYHDSPSVLLLQEKIEKKLRKNIMNWRKFSRTTFNHYCHAAFKKILPKLEEENIQQFNFSKSPEHFIELQNLLSTYQIRGFVNNFPYTTIADLINFVQKSGIHLNDNPNIEFALSVYAHSYNNNTVSIWLFIGTLVCRR